PVPPPGENKTTTAALVSYWYNQSTFVDGLSQETCRDLGHVQYGLAAMINAAETARVQGVDLFTLERDRIAAGLEYHADFIGG
ncbi:alginate lyase family protein, partial [Streptomyces scabiei]